MTPTPEAIEACRRTLDVANERASGRAYGPEFFHDIPGNTDIAVTFSRALREFSDAVKECRETDDASGEIAPDAWIKLLSFILPNPDPTPQEALRKAINAASESVCAWDANPFAELVAEALTTAGYEVRKIMKDTIHDA